MLPNQEGEDDLTEVSKCILPATATQDGSQGNRYPILAPLFPSICPVLPID